MVGCIRRRRRRLTEANLIESLQKQADHENLIIKLTRGLFDYGIIHQDKIIRRSISK